VNTTRIYLKTSGIEHRRELEAMGLVLPALQQKNKDSIYIQ